MWLTDTKIDRIAGLQSGRRKDLGHFWVTQSLCFKTRAMAKPSKWKYYDFLFSSLANKTPFRKKGFALWSLGFLERFGNGLLLLFKYPGADCPGYEQRRPPQLISSLIFSSFFGTMRYPVETGISAYLRKTRSFFFRLLEIGFRWRKTMHRGRAWTINLQAIGSTRGGTRSHINVTGILVGKFKLRDRV